MKHFVTTCLICLLALPAFGQALTRVDVPITPLQQGAVALGDLDGDGRLDVLMSGFDANNAPVTRLYRNEVSGSQNAWQFTQVGDGLPRANVATSLDLGDYDNDGDLDILFTGPFRADVYRNDGGFQFESLDADLPTATTSGGVFELVSSPSSAWGDYDGDGDLDILTTGVESAAGNTVSLVYRNDGGDQFTPVDVGLPIMLGGSVDWGDYNGDGRLDLLATHQPGPSGISFTKVFRNDGTNGNGEVRFTDIQADLPSTNALDAETGSAKWGDVDNDGRLDVLFVADELRSVTSTPVGVFRNTGAGTFEDLQDDLPPAFYADWMDLDGDGQRDVVLNRTEPQGGKTAATNTFLNVFRNEAGQFTEAARVPGIWFGAIAVGDLNRDRRPDVLLTGKEENDFRAGPLMVAAYANSTASTANQPPQPPTNLRTLRNETNSGTLDLVMEWDAGIDPDGDDAALTYNVRVGTSPGASDVLSAMAQPDGDRLVAQPGNAGHNQRLVLRNLDPTKSYYWSVQAIDASLAGSPFASEGVSVDTEEAPSLADVPRRVELVGNYPNPFNPTTTIRYALPEAMPVTLTVYNVLGAKVAVLVDASQSAGHHEVAWDGRNDSGTLVPSGLYLYRLETPGQTHSRKMVLMK
ncbi:MAG: T9SS type A sorting domain-containing protein [Bacteroidetes bacterium]|jgi:hypothetical protein|nr:T9SS type A sorting domain-containing protein [Bacteroidota bacterium]